MPHTYTNVLAHIIFSTKDRQPHIDADLRSRLFAYMGGVLRDIGATPLIVNGMDDHAHQLVGVPATRSVSEVVRIVKANSSKWVHEEFPERSAFAWQSGYGAFSVSQSNVDLVRQYIAHQEEHHRTMSFQEEYVAFLKRHGIAYDERYVWE
jgi:REP element-mobilizing transposase RayT